MEYLDVLFFAQEGLLVVFLYIVLICKFVDKLDSLDVA